VLRSNPSGPSKELYLVFKRISLLILTNLAVMAVLGVVLSVLERLGVFGPGFMQQYGRLLIIAGVFGFGGAFVSLLLSKTIAKWTTGAQVIAAPRNAAEAWLFDTVRRHAERVGIAMPEVAVYDAPEMNAFATGPSKNNSLVAVSTGLLSSMRREEVEAVLGHEVAHVANGDMVTLTLIQGVLNTFVIFFSRIIGGLVDSLLSRGEEREGPGIGYWISTIFAEIFLGILATLIVAWFSRRREFRADRGGAELAGTPSMVSALITLGRGQESHLPQSLQAFGIRGGSGGLWKLFASHPPIEQRVEALRQRGAASGKASFA
jgi:heat shock protein HtpX